MADDMVVCVDKVRGMHPEARVAVLVSHIAQRRHAVRAPKIILMEQGHMASPC